MDRRDYLKTAGLSVSLVSGCVIREDSNIKDTDGDGVIDSEDYAPRDPDVQEKSDLDNNKQTPRASPTKSRTQTNSPSPTAFSTPTPTATPTETATESSIPGKSDNTIKVSDSYWNGLSHITSYSREQVSAIVYSTDLNVSYSPVKLWVDIQEYPGKDVVESAVSSEFQLSESGEKLSLGLEKSKIPEDTRLEASIYLMPGDKSSDEVESNEWEFIMSTDPFKINSDSSIERYPHPDQLDPVSLDEFTRELIEGAYIITVKGRTKGKDWESGLIIWKSGYIQGINRSRGRTIPEYVSYELTQGIGSTLASILKEEAEDLGFTSRTDQVEFVIDYTQRLPYVTDDVSKGFDDYTKFIIETLPEGNGDCEDTSVLLASVLEASTFDEDMVLIEPPGHMAAGIWGAESMTGTYYEKDGRRYYYIETTGEGWGIGDIPEEYAGESAYVYQV